MYRPDFQLPAARIAELRSHRVSGELTRVRGDLVHTVGLERFAAIGDRVELVRRDGVVMGGEVLDLRAGEVVILPEGSGDGFALGDTVRHVGPVTIRPDNSWIGKLIDARGQDSAGRPLDPGRCSVPVRRRAPSPMSRRGWGARIATGVSVLDTFLPLVRGQRIGLFAGSGVGKTSLLGALARGVAADIVVIGLIGERGREVRDVVERVLGPKGMARAVVVAATADESPLIKRRAAWIAMAVAEHFRAQGAHVLLMLDSLTRLAEAHREVALANGESAALRGFPPSVVPVLTELCERSGPGSEGEGDITAIFSILVAASDMDEPIADLLRGVLDGHIVLDRAIAERGRFPAIDVLASVSRSLEQATSPEERQILSIGRARLARCAEAALMVQSGLYAPGSDPELDTAIATQGAMERFLGSLARGGPDRSFQRLAEALEVAPHDQPAPAEDQA